MIKRIPNSRQYFATNAPKEIPNWFRPAQSVPKMPPGSYPARYEDVPEEMRKRIDAIESREKKMKEIIKARQELEAPHREWARQVEEIRYFAWRWYYADKMCAWENKKTGENK